MFTIQPGKVAEFVERERSSEAIWLIHHIPKTAGSSLASDVRAAVGRFVNLVPDYENGHDGYIASLDRLTQDAVEMARGPKPPRVFSGHLRAADVERLRAELPQLRTLAFLRHPVARVLSEYNYCLSPAHPLSEQFAATYPTVEAYLEEAGEMNKMAWMMFGTTEIEPAEAAERMVERYTMLGLQERYPVSYLLMSALIWAPSTPRQFQRVGAKRAPPSAELSAAIVARNRIDMAMFERVSGIYDAAGPEIWQVLGEAPA